MPEELTKTFIKELHNQNHLISKTIFERIDITIDFLMPGDRKSAKDVWVNLRLENGEPL